MLQQKEASSPDEKGDFYVARYTHYNDLYFAQYKDDAYYPLSNLYGFAQYEKIRNTEAKRFSTEDIIGQDKK